MLSILDILNVVIHDNTSLAGGLIRHNVTENILSKECKFSTVYLSTLTGNSTY
jgi:hypothetical protein